MNARREMSPLDEICLAAAQYVRYNEGSQMQWQEDETMDKIRQAMLARLSDEDRDALRAIYAPVIVGVPPQDASRPTHIAVDISIAITLRNFIFIFLL